MPDPVQAMFAADKYRRRLSAFFYVLTYSKAHYCDWLLISFELVTACHCHCLKCDRKEIHTTMNSILLHSGLYPAWHFLLWTRFSCCLKMKSVENILGYVQGQFHRFLRGCKPRENLWNCSRRCPIALKCSKLKSVQKPFLHYLKVN